MDRLFLVQSDLANLVLSMPGPWKLAAEESNDVAKIQNDSLEHSGIPAQGNDGGECVDPTNGKADESLDQGNPQSLTNVVENASAYAETPIPSSPDELGEDAQKEPPALMSEQELIDLIKMSRSTINEKQDPKGKYFDPSFPKKIKLGKRRVAYSKSEVNNWIKSRGIDR